MKRQKIPNTNLKKVDVIILVLGKIKRKVKNHLKQ